MQYMHKHTSWLPQLINLFKCRNCHKAVIFTGIELKFDLVVVESFRTQGHGITHNVFTLWSKPLKLSSSWMILVEKTPVVVHSFTLSLWIIIIRPVMLVQVCILFVCSSGGSEGKRRPLDPIKDPKRARFVAPLLIPSDMSLRCKCWCALHHHIQHGFICEQLSLTPFTTRCKAAYIPEGSVWKPDILQSLIFA